MHKGEDLDCKVHLNILIYLSVGIESLWDLNYSRLAGTLLTVITEMF